MAGNNSIQILRGNNVKSTAADEVLLDGQPLYDRTTGYLYVGENRTVASTQAVNAHYANTAGKASSATQANYVKGYLYFKGAYSNGNTYNNSWDGRDTEELYVPTALGSTGQVWGMVNSNTAGWIDQTEIPGTIENANHANTADVAYEVSGSNVTGTVANANVANFANTAGKVEGTLELRIANTNVNYNGSVDRDFTSRNILATTSSTQIGGIPFSTGTGTTASISWLRRGNSGQVLSATASGIAWANQNTLNVNSANFANTAGGTNGTLSLTVMGDSFEYNGASNISVNNPFYNKRYDIVAYTTGVSKNGAVPYYSAFYSGIEFASPTSDDDKGYVLTYGGGSHVSWSPPVQLYAIEDLGSRMYIVFSSPFGSTDSISFFNSLTTKGYNSASNPFRVVYGVRDNRPIRAIYANTTVSYGSTRFTIMYLDGGTQFVSYNGTSSNPARLTIHPLSHYKDLGTV